MEKKDINNEVKSKVDFKRWFIETKNELKKVAWPTKKQTLDNTFIVFITIVLIGGLVWLFDAGLMSLINILLNKS